MTRTILVKKNIFPKLKKYQHFAQFLFSIFFKRDRLFFPMACNIE